MAIDTEKLREILTGHSRQGKERHSLSKLFYKLPPSAAGKAATQSIPEFLAGFPAFKGLTRREAGVLASLMHERSFGDGEVIFDERSPSAALYLIRNGCVELLRESAGRDGVLAAMGPNEFIGELALLLEDVPRLATARSRGPSELLALSRQDFETLMEKLPQAGLKVFRALVRVLAMRFQMLMEALESEAEE